MRARITALPKPRKGTATKARRARVRYWSHTFLWVYIHEHNEQEAA